MKEKLNILFNMVNVNEKFQSLKNWIETNGGFVNSKVELIHSSYGRTVMATDDITGERIFTLPKNLTLNCYNSKINLDQELFSYRNTVVIALLYEYNKPNSFWKPYLNLLPHLVEFKNHPQYLQAIGKFPTISKTLSGAVESSYSGFTDFYNKLIEYNQKNKILKKVQFEEVLWAYLCVITRMWSEVGLVPFADLLQHSNESTMAINNNDKELFMSGDFKSGDQVFDNYCVDDDLTLFLNFGFVDSSKTSIMSLSFLFDNEFKNINLFIDSLISRLNIKKLYLSSAGINTQLMRYLRLNFLDTNDLKLVDINQDNLGFDIISLQNEIKCLKKLRLRLNNLLPQDEIKFAESNISNYLEGTIEHNILKFHLKVESLRLDILKFIDDYWMNFLSDTSN